MVAIPSLTSSGSKHLVTFTVKADGEPLPATYGVISIEIRREINRVPRATLVLRDGDAAEQTFAVSEGQLLIPGAELEILAGYSSEEATLFKGLVTRHRVEVNRRGSRLVVELRDPVFRMTLGRHSRNFTDVTDGEVMEALIGLYPGLRADVSPTRFSHPQIVQHQVSDWDFLIMRAEMAGFAVICDDGAVSAAPFAVAGPAMVEAVFGEDVISAEIELDAGDQLETVEAGAWDMAGQALLTAQVDDVRATAPGDISGADLAQTGGRGAVLRHAGARDQAMLDQWADAAMGRSRRAAVQGRVQVQGDGAVVPGVLIELGGFGERFKGKALVRGVRHRIEEGDWSTEIFIGAPAKSHAERHAVTAPAAGGGIPPARGLQIGVVEALEGDPAGEERLQIRLATITETDGLVWARQALADAGKNRGVIFRPEIGDEVVVGFLDADPRDPVVLGAFHSSGRPSRITASDDNHEKAIVTRSGMRIHWNDDKVVTTISTPAGNRIVLSEDDEGLLIEDQNGNKIQMNSDGLALDSACDITLSATGDVKIKGVNVEISASASLKAEGSGGAELKSSATTVIKGSLVTIN